MSRHRRGVAPDDGRAGPCPRCPSQAEGYGVQRRRDRVRLHRRRSDRESRLALSVLWAVRPARLHGSVVPAEPVRGSERAADPGNRARNRRGCARPAGPGASGEQQRRYRDSRRWATVDHAVPHRLSDADHPGRGVVHRAGPIEQLWGDVTDRPRVSDARPPRSRLEDRRNMVRIRHRCGHHGCAALERRVDAGISACST